MTLDSTEHFPAPEVTADWAVIESGNTVKGFPTPNAPVTETAWTSLALDGIIQARPLVVNNIVVVATENDSLYGLNLADGTTNWGPVSIGTPETQTHVRSFPGLGGCGDIFPLGITSDPVFDPTTSYVYAVGEVQTGTALDAQPPMHEIIAVDPATGIVKDGGLPKPIDPASMPEVAAEQQRAGLVAANGRVYVGFGGLSGDCGAYHGYLVAVNDATLTVAGDLETTSTTNAGAIRGPAPPPVDSNGEVYVSTGNDTTNPPLGQTDYSDGVIAVDPSMSGEVTNPTNYFQPAEWRTDNDSDWDLGSAAPVLLPNGTQLFIIGKQHNAFLLNTSALGGASDPTHTTPVARLNGACAGQAFGGNAVIGHSAYIACSGGMQQVNLP